MAGDASLVIYANGASTVGAWGSDVTLQVADLLVRAGAVRGMELDINSTWPVFASFKPAAPNGLAAPANGASLIATYRGPATFFDPAYARDFITMSAAPVPGGG